MEMQSSLKNPKRLIILKPIFWSSNPEIHSYIISEEFHPELLFNDDLIRNNRKEQEKAPIYSHKFCPLSRPMSVHCVS